MWGQVPFLPIVLLLLRTNKPMRMDFLRQSIFLENFRGPRKMVFFVLKSCVWKIQVMMAHSDWVLHFFRSYFLLSQMLAVIVQEWKFCCIWFCWVLRNQQLSHFHIFDILGFRGTFCTLISCFLISFTDQVEFFCLCF